MLPPVFLDRLKNILPSDHLEACLATFAAPQVTSFRVNTLKATREEVLADLERLTININAVVWFENAFWVSEKERTTLLNTPLYKTQKIYIQNLSSMVPPLLLAPEANEEILDLTAAPGSKTLQMACMMGNTGTIAAVEVVRKRFFQLQANLKAQGATNVRTFLKDGTTVWRHRPNHFDKVLLDAPCSTEARFRLNDPDTFKYWSLRKIQEQAYKQEKLLESAVLSLRNGGCLVYSTCSFAPEENERVLHRVLSRFEGSLSIVPFSMEFPNQQDGLTTWQGENFHADLRHTKRILPNALMEGFFVAKLQKDF